MKQLQQIVGEIDPVKKKRSKIPVFLLFVFISTILWLLIKLSDEYTFNLSLPVSYKEIPSEKLLTEVTDPYLKFSITSRGFAILKVKYLINVRSASISLQQIPYRKRSQTEYYINTPNLREYLANAFRVNETDIVFEDTELRFMLEELRSKKVPVVAEYDIKYKQGFINFNEAVLKPDSVVIYGPSHVIDQIEAIETRKLLLKDVEQDIVTSLYPIFDSGQIRVNPSVVELFINVERFTETSMIVPVKKPDTKPGIKTFPENVTVNFLVSMKDYSNIDPTDFEIGLDTLGLHNNSPTLKIKVISQPKQIKNLQIEPLSVEYIRIRS